MSKKASIPLNYNLDHREVFLPVKTCGHLKRLKNFWGRYILNFESWGKRMRRATCRLGIRDTSPFVSGCTCLRVIRSSDKFSDKFHSRSSLFLVDSEDPGIRSQDFDSWTGREAINCKAIVTVIPVVKTRLRYLLVKELVFVVESLDFCFTSTQANKVSCFFANFYTSFFFFYLFENVYWKRK